MIELLLVIAIAGLIVWFVTTYVPMPPPFRAAIVVVAAICLLVYVLQAFGLIHWTLPR